MALVHVETPGTEIQRWNPPPSFLYRWDEMTISALQSRSRNLLEAQIMILERRGDRWPQPVPAKDKIPKQFEFPADITHRLTPEDLWFHPM